MLGDIWSFIRSLFLFICCPALYITSMAEFPVGRLTSYDDGVWKFEIRCWNEREEGPKPAAKRLAGSEIINRLIALTTSSLDDTLRSVAVIAFLLLLGIYSFICLPNASLLIWTERWYGVHNARWTMVLDTTLVLMVLFIIVFDQGMFTSFLASFLCESNLRLLVTLMW